jgi:hypothetical protein
MHTLILFLVLSHVTSIKANILKSDTTNIINHVNINYNSFTIIDKNYTLDDVINYSNNNIDLLNIDHHLNMYSTFTQNYFDNCDKNTPYCQYDLYDQYDTCKYVLENEGGNLYFYGLYKNELINILIGSDGTQSHKYVLNNEYSISGVYIISDLSNDEKYESEICFSEDTIKVYKYVSEPFNFYRRMFLNILSTDNETSFCPVWVLNN